MKHPTEVYTKITKGNTHFILDILGGNVITLKIIYIIQFYSINQLNDPFFIIFTRNNSLFNVLFHYSLNKTKVVILK